MLALLISSGVCLLFLEILFRTVFTDEKLRPKDWSDRPKFYYVPENAKTLQDRSYSEEKAPNTFRVAVVGDSFAFAPYMQFDDTFSKRLERMLGLNETSHKVEVINYGVPRYSTSHEIALTERALKERADLIILQICLNDPEIKPYRPTGLIGGVVDRFGGIEYKEGILSWWKTGAFVAKRIYNSQSQNKYINYFYDLWEKKKTQENFTNSFKKIRDISASANVPLVGVIFPLVGLPIDENYPFAKIHQQIQDYCEEFNVPCLDLMASYKGLPTDRLQVIVRKDFHPNEIGHRIAAEEIYLFLEEKGLIPEEVKIKRRVSERIGIEIGK